MRFLFTLFVLTSLVACTTTVEKKTTPAKTNQCIALSALVDFELLVEKSFANTLVWVYERKDEASKKELVLLTGENYTNIKSRLHALPANENEKKRIEDLIKMTGDVFAGTKQNIMHVLKTPEDYEDPMSYFQVQSYMEENIHINNELLDKTHRFIERVEKPLRKKCRQNYILTMLEAMLEHSRGEIYQWVYTRRGGDAMANKNILENNYPGLEKDIKAIYGDSKEVSAVLKDVAKLKTLHDEIRNTLVVFEDYETPTKKFMCEALLSDEILPLHKSIVERLHVLQEKNQ